VVRIRECRASAWHDILGYFMIRGPDDSHCGAQPQEPIVAVALRPKPISAVRHSTRCRLAPDATAPTIDHSPRPTFRIFYGIEEVLSAVVAGYVRDLGWLLTVWRHYSPGVLGYCSRRGRIRTEQGLVVEHRGRGVPA
jgi:hypothetical protein